MEFNNVNKPLNSTWHQLQAEEVVRLHDVNLKTGLVAEEVKRRQEKFGLNRITARRGTPTWLKFLQQFNQPLVYILLVAVGVTAFLGEWVDSSVIFGVVLINAIVGFLQEAKAEKAISALASMVATETSVRRDGRQQRVHSEQLVPGDVVLLQSGDRVPADLRLVQMKSLQVDESALTGESIPVQKHPDALALDTVLADRKNLAFTGTLVTSGQGEGVVWATGDQTETGHIAQAAAVGDPGAGGDHVRHWRRAGREGRRDVHGGGGDRRGCDSRRLACCRHHRAGHRRRAHGQTPCHHPQTSRRGNAGQHDGYLLGQDRHAD
jgi:cation-transporting ATPase F